MVKVFRQQKQWCSSSGDWILTAGTIFFFISVKSELNYSGFKSEPLLPTSTLHAVSFPGHSQNFNLGIVPEIKPVCGLGTRLHCMCQYR